MLIRVEKKHIRSGTRRSEDACPVALAVREQLQPDVEILGKRILFPTGPFTAKFVELPREAKQFIRKYDHGHRVAPFVFHLNQPR